MLAAILVLAGSVDSLGATLSVDSPLRDTLLIVPQTALSGRATPDGAAVTAWLDGKSYKATVAGGRWTIASVPLTVGLNRVKIVVADQAEEILLVRGEGLVARGLQNVYLNWTPGVDEELRLLARTSISPPPTPDELDMFVKTVKTRVPEIFTAIYGKVARVALVSLNGADVHEVRFLPQDTGVFGLSPYDCGNAVPKEESQVYVGSLRKLMSAPDGPRGFISTWDPMKRQDSVAVRAEDVAEVLGRTAAHETGHALGLVGDSRDPKCAWMNGCEGGHNCAQFDADLNGLASRFAHGWHVMDPGPKSDNNARLGEGQTDSRGLRQAATFESFSRSYLQLIHPLPQGVEPR